MRAATVGANLAKAISAVHGVEGRGQMAFRKSLKRPQVLTFFASLKPCWSGL